LIVTRKHLTCPFSPGRPTENLRTVHDLLEKAELFFQQPAWAEVWASGDKKKILEELSPGAIRRKLSRPRFDPVYGFFTELGTHGTWEALRKRITQTGKKEDRTEIAMRIGGTPWDSEVEMVIACCILTALSCLLMIGKVYETRLHVEEVVGLLRARFETAGKFLQEHFVVTRRKSGNDAILDNRDTQETHSRARSLRKDNQTLELRFGGPSFARLGGRGRPPLREWLLN